MPLSKLKGRKLMLCDMVYQKPNKKTEWKDYLVIIYRDLITQKKEKLVIEEPTIDIYSVKPEYRTFGKPRHFLPKDQLTQHTVKYKSILYEIAKIAGDDYVEYYKTHTSLDDRKKLYKYPYVLGADIDIETYYRTLWVTQLNCEAIKKPTILALDIEVDQIDYDGNIARNGECEINLVSIVDPQDKIAYSFAFDNGNNPQIKDFVINVDKAKTRFHEMFDETYGGYEWKIFMLTDEIEMLTQVFKLIHYLRRDFILIWNMAFDIPYIIGRLKHLGVDPTTVMCDQTFPTSTLYYHNDVRSYDFANKKDFFSISDCSHYSDDMINYAGLRKSQGAVKRVNLGYIAKKEINDTKLDYSDAGNIRTLPYEDYETFILYGIKDTLLQIGIEQKTHDTENIYNIAMTNCVPYKDTLKQTVVFRGLLYLYLYTHDMVLGHNVNYDSKVDSRYDENGDMIQSDEDDDSYEGAINGDPELNIANGLEIFGEASKYLYGLTIDFDYSAMYPNSIVAYNIFATSLLGKLYIEGYTLDNPYDVDMGKEYIEDVIANNMIFTGEKWHKLSSVDKLALKLKEKYNL